MAYNNFLCLHFPTIQDSLVEPEPDVQAVEKEEVGLKVKLNAEATGSFKTSDLAVVVCRAVLKVEGIRFFL